MAQPPTTQMIEVGRGGIEYADIPATEGDDLAPLVLLHEGLGSLGLWRSFPADLAAATGRRTVVYSRHGYGRSAVVTEPRGVEYMHEEGKTVLPLVLTELHVARPVLVGHSDGASIALIHAGSGGDVAGLVLLAPHVVVEDVSLSSIEAAREAFTTTDLRERMAKHHDDVDATFWGWNDIWLSPDFRSWDITDLLPEVRCPTLAIQGLDDQYGTLRQLAYIADAASGPVTRVELHDCAHSPHLDQPQATLEAAVSFLADLT